MPPSTLAATKPVAARAGVRGWQARLALRFEAGGEAGTRLVYNRHHGPMRLLKALASGDGRRLEAVIVHPPGGLVGGDELALEVELDGGAQVLATTPGAQKWYRGETTATATTRIALAAGSHLEWLPQPAILFDHSHARQALVIELDPAASCVGWEVLVRGRKAMGERPARGHIEQSLSISVGQRPLWQERLYADAADRLFESPLGWDGQSVAASAWCCAPSLDAARLRDLRDVWRALLEAPPHAPFADPPAPASGAAGRIRGGATLAADGLLLAKMLADDGEQLMAMCQSLWRAARLSLDGDEGSAPRVWRT